MSSLEEKKEEEIKRQEENGKEVSCSEASFRPPHGGAALSPSLTVASGLDGRLG